MLCLLLFVYLVCLVPVFEEVSGKRQILNLCSACIFRLF